MSCRKFLMLFCILLGLGYSQENQEQAEISDAQQNPSSPADSVRAASPSATIEKDEKENGSKTDAAALKRYEDQYDERVRERDDLISSESIAKNIDRFLQQFKKDLIKEGISGRVIIRDIAFDTSLVKDGANLLVYQSVFFEKKNAKDKNASAVEFIPNEYKNKLFYLVDDNGISIEKGISKGPSFSRVMKKEKVSYSIAFVLSFVNQELRMLSIVKDIDDKTVFTKTYRQAYKIYGIFKYHERKIRLGFGFDAGLGFIIASETDARASLALVSPNFFVGFFIPKVGVAGAQLDVAFFSSFDYFSFSGFFNWDMMETAGSLSPAHVLLEIKAGFGFQFRDVNTTTAFMRLGAGFRLDIFDVFFLRVGADFFITKKTNSRQFNGLINGLVFPPQITVGGGFYIL